MAMKQRPQKKWILSQGLLKYYDWDVHTHTHTHAHTHTHIYIWLILKREWKWGEKERQREEERRNIHLLFHLSIHSLIDSFMCPEQGLNPQPWHIRTTLQPAELPRQGQYCDMFDCFCLDSDSQGRRHTHAHTHTHLF